MSNASDALVALVMTNRLEAQRRGLLQATSSIQQGVSMLQTAEQSLETIQGLVRSIREEAASAASATTQAARNSSQTRIEGWLTDINPVAAQSAFNDRGLLDGTLSALASADRPRLSPRTPGVRR